MNDFYNFYKTGFGFFVKKNPNETLLAYTDLFSNRLLFDC